MSPAEMKTVIADDIEIVGSIKCASNIQIDGKLNGDLTCNGDALLGNSCSIKGSVNVKSTTVNGQINGNITAKDKIDLKSSARVTGDIRAKRLTVEDGVTFIGKAEITPAAVSKAPETVKEISPEDTKEQIPENKGLFKK
jgi:cytoskeletal protein CcmA (bactofilin family)